MNEFNEAQRAAERAAELAFAVWGLGLVVSLIAGFWIFRDAEARGKAGIAAALLVLVSASLDFRITVFVLCVWVLLRPDKQHRGTTASKRELPEELPSGIVVGPSAAEFLGELQTEGTGSAGQDTQDHNGG